MAKFQKLWVVVIPWVMLCGLAQPALAQNTFWSAGVTVTADSQDPTPSNNSATLCLGMGNNLILLNTATVQSGGVDPNPSNNSTAFCLPVTFTLGQRVWEDSNGNGIQDANEPGMVGVTVQLLDSNGSLLQVTTSGVNGVYQFSGVAAGAYTLRFLPPTGYQLTPATQGSDRALDSDADPTTTRTPLLTLSANDQTKSAGLFRPVTISNQVWEDINGNGVQDAGEPGLSGVTVQLFDSLNTLVASTMTDSTGAYTFSSLRPGDYSLIVSPPATP